MAEWFRSHHGAPTDPKWLVVAKLAGSIPGVVSCTWWAIEDFASQNAPRGSAAGFDTQTWAAFTGWPEGEIEAVIGAFHKKGLLAADGTLTAWAKRQPKREDEGITDRVREHRERQRDEVKRKPEKGNAAKRNVTHGNARKRKGTRGNDIEREREKDRESTDVPPSAAANGPADTEPAPKSWSTIAGETWEQVMEGTAPYGMIGATLKPLVEAHGEQEVLGLWEKYLRGMADAGRSSFASPAHFAQRYGRQKDFDDDLPAKKKRNPTLTRQDYDGAGTGDLKWKK